MSKTKQYTRKPVFYITVAIIVYCAIWIFVSFSRFYSLNADVYDLGLSMQRIWNLTAYNLGFLMYLYIFLTSAVVYLFIPVGLFGNEQILLIIQTVALSLPAFVLYCISKELKIEGSVSLIFSLSYLIYFPLAGINFFDFHFQAFFILFFLLGYYFYLRSRYVTSILFFFLAGATHFPFFSFILIFALIEFFPRFLIPRMKRSSPVIELSVKKKWYLLILATISVLMLLGGELIGRNGLNSTLHIQNPGVFSLWVVANAFFVFIILLLPFLYTQVFSKWSIFLLPSFALILISHYSSFYVPSIFLDQYTSAIIPFIFLGLLDVFSKEKSWRTRTLRRIRIDLTTEKGRKLTATLMFILILSAGVFFAPFGPLNKFSGENLSFGSVIEYNATQYNTLTEFLGLIPRNSSAVLVQDNIPQAYPRNGPLNGSIIVPGVLGPSVNLSDARLNSFPVFWGGTVEIDYALADLNSVGYFTSPVTGLYGYNSTAQAGIPSMYDLIHVMLQSGSYGVLAEKNGFLLVKRGYTGPPEIFQKSTVFIHGSDFEAANSPHIIISNESVVFNGFTGAYAWYGPYIYLPPGVYNATFLLKLNKGTVVDHMALDSNSGGIKFASANYYNITSSGSTMTLSFTLKLTLDNVYGSVEFRGENVSEQGTLTFEGVELNMLGS